MKPNHEEKKALKHEPCECCAIVGNSATVFSECARDRMFKNMLRSGFRSV